MSKNEFRLTKVQALIRGLLVRKRFNLFKKQQSSIVRLQSWFRGQLTRKKLEEQGVWTKLREKKEELLCCKKCKETEKEMLMMMQKISSMGEEIEENKKQKTQHEKALRYLFEQVAQLRQVINDL